MQEIWKDVKGYENKYLISNYGRVKSLYGNNGNYREKILKQNKNKGGYLYVNLSKNSKHKLYKIHRLVAQAFLENNDNLPCVNHKDEDKENNNINNLEWCSYKYNVNYGTGIERMKNKLYKQVLQYDLNNNLIKVWESISKASENGFNTSHISECCKGKRKQHKGFVWKYEEKLIF